MTNTNSRRYAKSTSTGKVHAVVTISHNNQPREETLCDSMLFVGSGEYGKDDVTCKRCLRQMAKQERMLSR